MHDPRTAEVDLAAVITFVIDIMQGAVRRNGVPAHVHPIHVYLILRHLFEVVRSELLAAALLHDVIEDTATSKELIAERFGEEVADRVVAQTYVGISESIVSKPDDRRTLKYDNKLRRIQQWDLGNCLILFADILDNLFCSDGNPDDFCRELYRNFVMEETLPALETRLKQLNWTGPLPSTLISGEGLYIGSRPIMPLALH